MSDVVSVGKPLPPREPEIFEGIVVAPDPEKDHPIVCALTDVTGLVLNFVGPEQEHLEEIAKAIAEAQLHIESGLVPPALWFIDPQFGHDFRLTTVGLRHIVGVVRGYAQKVDAVAKRPGGKVLRPSIGFDDLHVRG